MISDVLSDAVNELDRYLDSPEWAGTYTGSIEQEIRACRNEMDRIRAILDTPPTSLSKIIPPLEPITIKVRELSAPEFMGQ